MLQHAVCYFWDLRLRFVHVHVQRGLMNFRTFAHWNCHSENWQWRNALIARQRRGQQEALRAAATKGNCEESSAKVGNIRHFIRAKGLEPPSSGNWEVTEATTAPLQAAASNSVLCLCYKKRVGSINICSLFRPLASPVCSWVILITPKRADRTYRKKKK